MCVLTFIILCVRISYLLNSKIFRLKLSNQEVSHLLLQRGIDLPIHLLNYSLHSMTLLESLMRMEKNMGDFNCNVLPVSFYNANTQALLNITNIYRKISSPIKGNSTIIYRQFEHFNRDSFRPDILAQLWDDLKRVHNPNEMWLKWRTLFLEVSHVHVPSDLSAFMVPKVHGLLRSLRK